MERDVLKWMSEGDIGASSMTMAFAVCEIPHSRHTSPWDVGDFHRCLLLLDAVPAARDRLHLLRGVSPEWAGLVDRWDELESTFLEEAGLGWTKAGRAPRTARMMEEIRMDVAEGRLESLLREMEAAE